MGVETRLLTAESQETVMDIVSVLKRDGFKLDLDAPEEERAEFSESAVQRVEEIQVAADLESDLKEFLKDPYVPAVVVASFGLQRALNRNERAEIGRVELLYLGHVLGSKNLELTQKLARSEYEDAGDWVSMVRPQAGYEETQSYRGSKTELLPHQEMIQTKESEKPIDELTRFVMLHCVANDVEVPTSVISIRSIIDEMPDEFVEAMKLPIYKRRVFDAAAKEGADAEELSGFSLIHRREGLGEVTAIDLDIMSSDDPRGQSVLQYLASGAQKHAVNANLRPGEVAIVNNPFAFHGRPPITQKNTKTAQTADGNSTEPPRELQRIHVRN